MAGIVSTFSGYVGTVLAACKPYARTIAAIMLVVQTIGWLVQGFGQTMMYGDGPFFLFAILTGKPWLVKWADISVRGTVYVLSALPTLAIDRLFHLPGYGLEVVFSLFFFGIPLLTTLWACDLVWRKRPEYLLFPVAQFAFFGFLSFGFASEFLYASGFLWAAAFLILERKVLSVGFALAFVACVFTHEMALPAAAVIGWLGWQQAVEIDAERGNARGRLWLGLLYAAVVVTYLYLRLNGGGAGSDENALAAINPARVFKGPAFWYLIGWSLAGLGLSLWLKDKIRKPWLIGALLVVIVALPLVLRLCNVPVNFALGRYDAPRTLGAVSLLLLSLAFATTLPGFRIRSAQVTRQRLNPALYVCACLAAAGAANLGTGIAFMRDLTLMVQADERLVETPGVTADSGAYPEARIWKEAPARDAWIINRFEEPWTRLYRSVVLAKGYEPHRLVYAALPYDTCDKLKQVGDTSMLPAQTLSEVETVACRTVDVPPKNGLTVRLGRMMQKVFAPSRLAASPGARPAG